MSDADRAREGDLCARCREPLKGRGAAEPRPGYCVKCGLGWKPLDAHGFCNRCRIGL